MKYVEDKYLWFPIIVGMILAISIFPIINHFIEGEEEIFSWWWETFIERQTWFTILWVLVYQYFLLPLTLIVSFNRAFKGKEKDIKGLITGHGQILFGGGIIYFILTLFVDVSNDPIIQVPIGYQILLGLVILIIDLYITPDNVLYGEKEK